MTWLAVRPGDRQVAFVRDGNVDMLVVVISRLCNQQSSIASTYMNLEHMTIVYTSTQLMVSRHFNVIHQYLNFKIDS